MAISITVDGEFHTNNRMHKYGTGNLGVYATGGIAVAPGDVGLGRLDEILVMPAGGYTFEYDKTNKKIKSYPATTTETADTTDITAIVFRFLAVGV